MVRLVRNLTYIIHRVRDKSIIILLIFLAHSLCLFILKILAEKDEIHSLESDDETTSSNYQQSKQLPEEKNSETKISKSCCLPESLLLLPRISQK